MLRKQLLSFVIASFSVLFIQAQNFHVQEDFNGAALPTGWTTNALSGANTWMFGLDGFADDPGNQNIDGTSFAFFDDDMLGVGSLNNTAELVTPVFDNSADLVTTLEFDYNFRQFGANIPDSFAVEVFDGAVWVSVFDVNVNDCGRYIAASCNNGFPHAVVDISAYANANCQVRFIYHDGNDWAFHIGLDNVVISSPFPNDVMVSEIITPVTGCGLTSAETVSVQIKNVGTIPASGFSVSYQIDGNTPISDPFVGTIAPGDSMVHTFATTADLSVIQPYTFRSYTTLTNDGNVSNDTTISIIENEVLNVPTFTDDFEGANLWKVQGTNASWELGVPSGTIINSSTSGTMAYVTDLNGNYNANELSYLVSPCFNFSGGIGDPIVSFDLNYRTEANFDSLVFEASFNNGVTWQKVNAGFNATNWYNAPGRWQGNSGGWIPVENILTGFNGQSQVIFRFKLQTDVSGNFEGVGLDNFSVRYPQPIDMSLNSILFPGSSNTPLCGLGNSNIIVEVENKGANQIDSVFMFYRVDNGAVVADTLIASIAPNSLRNFTFGPKFNFTAFTTYDLDVWLNVPGDGFNPNDSVLNRQVTNTMVTIVGMPFSEDFETSVPGTGFNNGGSGIPANWVRNTATGFHWGARNSPTGSFGTGPDMDNTPAPGDNFMYTEASTNGTPAILETPCIDLGNVTGAIMEVWTHRFGNNMTDLFIDVYDGSQWINVSTLSNTPQNGTAAPYTENILNLNAYAGRRVKIRFRTGTWNGFASDMAIDDIFIFEPIPQDIKVASLISPVDGCAPDGTVTVELENFGSADINTPFPIELVIDGGTPITETVDTFIAVGSKINYTFNAKPNFTAQATTFNIVITTFLPGDSNTFDNVLSSSVTNQTQPVSYLEDFESFTDGECPPPFGAPANDLDVLPLGWRVESTGGGSEWQVHDVGGCGNVGPSGNTLTGPIADNTIGLGAFMYVESSDGNGTTQLISPCIDFGPEQGAGMTFWYHAFGTGIGTLTIDVFANGVWNTIPGFSIVGQQQTAQNDPWLLAEVKFNQFAGQGLIIRFNYNYTGGFGARGDIAIDDIGFFAPKPRDARMVRVLGPNEGCEISDQSIVSIEVENFGSLDIQPDTLMVGYQIDTLPPVLEAVPFLIPADQTAMYTFTTPADLSIRSNTYNIRTFTALPNDQDRNNDTIEVFQARNETKITNYFENFEGFRDASVDNMLGQVMDNGWTTPNVGRFNWNVQNAENCGKNDRVTPTPFTGPSGDHTTGSGTFLYTEADSIPPPPAGPIGLSGEALFESPCIDLRANTSARMNFWYHRYGANLVDLQVQVDSGAGYQTIFTLTGQTHTFAQQQWNEQTIDLDAYVGKLVRVRFRSFKPTTFGFRADCAIDDILIYEPATIDVGLTELVGPLNDACDLGKLETSIMLENFGTQAIPAGQVYVEYSVNSGPWFGDTVQQALPVGTGNITHVFTDSIDFEGERGLVELRYRAVLNGDTILENNVLRSDITNQRPGLPYYLMDFEQHDPGTSYNTNDLRGWTRTPALGAVPTTFMWHVQCGPAPSIMSQMGAPPVIPNGPATGPSGDHTFATPERNGTGTYMLLETNMWSIWTSPLNFVPDAELVMPCGSMDFSQSVESEPMLSYWYHMFGPETGALEVDISFDGGNTYLNAIDKINGQQQQANTDPWLQRRVPLGQFLPVAPAVNNDVVLRFRAVRKTGIPTLVYQGEGRGGDIAIDDIEILDRVEKDAAVVRVLDPRSNCDLTTSENFRIRIQNVGTEDILTMHLGYQVTFFPIVVDPITNLTTKGTGQIMPMELDSIVGQTIVPLATFDFAFNNLDLAQNGSYEIKVWTQYIGDNNQFNDTLCFTVTNVTRPFPSCEDFSSLTLGDRFRDFQDEVLPNFWSGSQSAYAFEASIENAGPVVGHTGGLNDIYMLVTDPVPPSPGQQTQMESPCFDLTSTQSAILEFWYIMPNPSGNLVIRARNRGAAQFIDIDTIRNQVEGPAFTWTQRRVVLTDFVGDFVELEFENTSTIGSFTAIDDICLIEPEPQQVALQEFLWPLNGNCFYSSNEVVSLRLRNIGSDRITSFDVVLAVDKGFISNPRGNFLRDTVTINATTAPFFDPGDRFTLNLDSLGFIVDMSDQVQYFFSAYILLPGDNDSLDNRLIDHQVTHPIPLQLPYCEDFENGVAGSQLAFQGAQFYNWAHLNTGTGIFPSGIYPGTQGLTGPSVDHTIGDATGHYLLSDGAAGNAGEVIATQSRCLDLSQTIMPEMEYWYYMFVPDGATLILQINDDNGWVTVDQRSNTDPDQGTQFRNWKSQIIDLSAYRGRFIRYRFLIVNASVGAASNVALDDICVYDVAAKDASAFELLQPNADSTSCYSKEQEVIVGVRNNGVSDIGLPGDTVTIEVNIFKDLVFEKTLRDTFFLGNFPANAPFPRDSVGAFRMDSTFDMSMLGSTFRFDITVLLNGDLISSNNVLDDVNILSQRHVGMITSVTPNDVTCFGVPVTITNTGYFGTLLWENRILDANGNGTWFPVQTPPRDRPSYIAIPDSTTEYRTRVCPQLFFTIDSVDETSDSVRIEIIKPYAPTGINDFECADEIPNRELRVNIPSNSLADSIFWYNDMSDTTIIHRMAVADSFFISRLLDNDTLYAATVQYDPRLDAPGYCTSTLTSGRGEAIAGFNHIPLFRFTIDPFTGDTVETKTIGFPADDSTITSYGNLFDDTFTDDIRDTICADVSPGTIPVLNETVFLDAGQRQGSQWTYEWERIELLTEDTVTFNTQTVVVDHLDLQVQQSYSYQVTITTDSGCIATSAKYIIYVGNGCITSLGETELNKDEFNIYPNPVKEELTITYKSDQSFKGDIELRSAEGQLIEIFRDVTFGSLEQKIDMSNLAKGIYFIKVNSDAGTLVEKVVKN